MEIALGLEPLVYSTKTPWFRFKGNLLCPRAPLRKIYLDTSAILFVI